MPVATYAAPARSMIRRLRDDTVQDEIDDVALALLEERRIARIEPERLDEGMVRDREEAHADDADQELGRVDGPERAQAELGGEEVSPGANRVDVSRDLVQQAAAAQGLPADQADERRAGEEKVDVLG